MSVIIRKPPPPVPFAEFLEEVKAEIPREFAVFEAKMNDILVNKKNEWNNPLPQHMRKFSIYAYCYLRVGYYKAPNGFKKADKLIAGYSQPQEVIFLREIQTRDDSYKYRHLCLDEVFDDEDVGLWTPWRALLAADPNPERFAYIRYAVQYLYFRKNCTDVFKGTKSIFMDAVKAIAKGAGKKGTQQTGEKRPAAENTTDNKAKKVKPNQNGSSYAHDTSSEHAPVPHPEPIQYFLGRVYSSSTASRPVPPVEPAASPFSAPVPAASPFSAPVPAASPFSAPVPAASPFSAPVPPTSPFSAPVPPAVPKVSAAEKEREEIERKVAQLEHANQEKDTEVQQLREEKKEQEKKMEAMEKRIEEQEKKKEAMEKRIEEQEKKKEAMEKRIDEQEKELGALRKLLHTVRGTVEEYNKFSEEA